MYCVYKHTTPNGKVYIGITSKNPLKRWNNGIGYSKNILFYRAIVKYGWDNIKHEILLYGLTEEEACKKEIELIAEYKSTNPDYGYNLSIGGQSGCNGYKWNDKQKENLSKSHKGIKRTTEARKHISEGKKGCKNPNWGKHPSKETLEKCRISSLKENLTTETRKKLSDSHKKPIICVELKITFDSALEAEKELGILASSICKVLKNVNGHKSAGGYHWEYLRGENNE